MAIIEFSFFIISAYFIYLGWKLPRKTDRRYRFHPHVASGIIILIVGAFSFIMRAFSEGRYPSFTEYLIFLGAGFGVVFGGFFLAMHMPRWDSASLRGMILNLVFLLINTFGIWFLLFAKYKYFGFYLGLIALIISSSAGILMSLSEGIILKKRFLLRNQILNHTKSQNEKQGLVRLLFWSIWNDRNIGPTKYKGFAVHSFFVLFGCVFSIFSLVIGINFFQCGHDFWLNMALNQNLYDSLQFANYSMTWSISLSGFLITVIVGRGMHSIRMGTLLSLLINFYPVFIAFFIAPYPYLKIFASYGLIPFAAQCIP